MTRAAYRDAVESSVSGIRAAGPQPGCAACASAYSLQVSSISTDSAAHR
jgi:hypothetical protein